MATIKRNFSTSAEILNTTLSSDTESYSSDVNLETNGFSGTHLFIAIDFDTTPTDNVLISLYGSLDGTNYDNVAFFTQEVSNALDPSALSIIVKDVLHFRVGAKQTGTTDSHSIVIDEQSWNFTDS